MSSTFKALLTPIQVGSHTLRNRIQMSALTRNRSPQTYPTDLVKEYYVQRARGGAGLIVTEGILVTRQGTEWPFAPGLWDEKHVAAWKPIVDAVHAEGAKIYAQLWHVGRVAHPDAPEQKLAGTPVYGPSDIAARGGLFRHIPGRPGYVAPTPVEDPWTLVNLFKQAAVNAKAAGFDGVEIHGANGYLVNQFLDSTVNKRTDQWGGSVENRSRFGLEVFKATKEVYGPDVAIKLNPTGGYNDVGMPLEEALETFRYFITEVDKLSPSYITLARYNPLLDVEFDGKKRGTQHDVLESYRDYVKNAKLYLNSGIQPEEGEKLVAEGKVDAISFGFNWILHPDLVKRLDQGVPLNNAPDFATLQGGKPGNDDWSIGYTDYPTATA